MRCLVLRRTMHAQNPASQPVVGRGEEGVSQYIKSGSTIRIGGLFSYVQRPHLEKQLNKPKLQLRFPSAPISQFLAFLLPPTCIGAVPCKSNKYDMADMIITVVGV
jgi:hypothetical protein